MKQSFKRIVGGCYGAMMLTMLNVIPLSAQNTDGVNDSVSGIPEQLLNEVVVTAKAPAVKITPDKIVYDLKSSVMGQSGTLLDALSSVPGINVSGDGAVKLYGNGGAVILIDGQKLHLKGLELANYLRSLPATTVGTIGIRTTVNARDDASDKAGVIEITTMRLRERGFTIGVNGGASAWRNARCNGSINLGYNTTRSEFTLLYSLFAARQRVKLDIDRFFITDTDRLLQHSTRRRTDNSHSLKAGWHYKPSAHTVVSANLSYSTNRRNEFGRMDAFLTSLNQLKSSDNRNRNRRHQIMADLYIEHRFNSGATLSGSLNHFRNKRAERQLLEPSAADTLCSLVGGRIRWFIDRIDFTQPFGSDWKLQAGIKNTFIAIRNSGTYFDRKAGEWTANNSLSSKFRYNANTNAAYAQVAFTRSNLAATVGARLESERIRGNFSGNETAPDTSYRIAPLDIVPVMDVKYFTNRKTAFMLAYSRRIQRPNYADLNPFVYVFDEYTHEGGNIRLHSSTSDNLQFGFSYGGHWQGALFLTHSSDAIMKSYHELPDGSVYVASENLPFYLRYGFRVILANQPIGRRCHTTVTAIGIYNRYDLPSEISTIRTRRFTPIVNIDTQFDFGAGWTGELQASYTGRMAYGQATLKPSGYVDAALRKSFYNGKASMTLFVKDIFATNLTRAELSYASRTAGYNETEYKRMIGFSFHYEFHTGRKSSRIRKGNDPEELDRL